MQENMTRIIHHMARSKHRLADIFETERRVVKQMSSMIGHLPAVDPSFGDLESLIEHAMDLNRSVTTYLNGLAGLEEALADNLALIVKELKEDEGEE